MVLRTVPQQMMMMMMMINPAYLLELAVAAVSSGYVLVVFSE